MSKYRKSLKDVVIKDTLKESDHLRVSIFSYKMKNGKKKNSRKKKGRVKIKEKKILISENVKILNLVSDLNAFLKDYKFFKIKSAEELLGKKDSCNV